MISFVAGWESERNRARTQTAMDRLKAEDKPRGRPKGSKDKKTRKKTGYLGNNNKNKNRVGAKIS